MSSAGSAARGSEERTAGSREEADTPYERFILLIRLSPGIATLNALLPVGPCHRVDRRVPRVNYLSPVLAKHAAALAACPGIWLRAEEAARSGACLRQAGSHRQPLFFLQMIFSPPAATPVVPASAYEAARSAGPSSIAY